MALASPRFQLASTVAEFAEVLKGTYWSRDISLRTLADTAPRRFANQSDATTRELVGLVQRAASLAPAPAPAD